MILSRRAAAPGQSLGVAGAGFAPHSSVRLALAGSDVGSLPADGVGGMSGDVTVPGSTPAGEHRLTASGPSASGGTQVLAASLTVGAGAAQPGAAALASTGASARTRPLTGLAAALVVAGAAAVAATRRRLRRPTD